MMNTTVKAKNLVEARRLLANFQELWDEAAIQQNYSNSGKLRTLAEKLHSMKLRDDFFNCDLSSEDLATLTNALIIANL